MTQEGLCDVLMLGNVIELADVFALNSSTHHEKSDPTIFEEEATARWRYRQFLAWIAAKHVVVMNGTIVSPWYLFQRSLIEFASSLCAYKEACPNKISEYSFTPETLRKTTIDCIKADWPMLLPRFLQRLESPTGFFTWTGPRFEIWPRDKLPPHFLILEAKELPESPVFSPRIGRVESQPKGEKIVASSKVDAKGMAGRSMALGDGQDSSNMEVGSDGG